MTKEVFTKAQSLNWTITKLTRINSYLHRDILSDAEDLGNSLYEVCTFNDNKEIKQSIIEVIASLLDKVRTEFDKL